MYSDEELLGQGIELNDYIQTVLVKHDAIASGSPIPFDNNPKPQIELHSEEKEESPKASVALSSPVTEQFKTEPQEEEEEIEDDFALLARRYRHCLYTGRIDLFTPKWVMFSYLTAQVE